MINDSMTEWNERIAEPSMDVEVTDSDVAIRLDDRHYRIRV